MLRDLIRCAGEISDSAYSGIDEAKDILDIAERKIFECTERRVAGQSIAIKELVRRLSEIFTTLMRSGRAPGVIAATRLISSRSALHTGAPRQYASRNSTCAPACVRCCANQSRPTPGPGPALASDPVWPTAPSPPRTIRTRSPACTPTPTTAHNASESNWLLALAGASMRDASTAWRRRAAAVPGPVTQARVFNAEVASRSRSERDFKAKKCSTADPLTNITAA